MAYARQSGAVLRWSVAVDKASVDVLQNVECDKATKIRWLRTSLFDGVEQDGTAANNSLCQV
eukprot:3572051-Amphidinium_carterae.1